MIRKFNTTGICVPNMHYMVDISEKVEMIFQLVDDGCYFTINRGRQYGKTTTIGRLRKRLYDDGNYICIIISLQYTTDKMFADEEGFCQGLLTRIHRALSLKHKEEAKFWLDESVTSLQKLDYFLTERCTGKKIVLIIDESDEATNNDLFVRFLKMLRDKFLFRNLGDDFTFQSVILAGVYDIRNLKQKMILSGKYTPSTGESKTNSPWNIAADFDIDMSFSAKEIETMLVEYENDHHTGMNINEIAQEIRYYTSGYPYLVSRICWLIDARLDCNWTLDGVQEAIKWILDENSMLFLDLTKKVEDDVNLQNLLFELTVGKKEIPFNAHDPVINLGLMFCFLSKFDRKLIIHNKIFEIAITNYFISRNTTTPILTNVRGVVYHEIVKDGVFDMEICLTKFSEHYAEIYTDKDIKFLERDGTLIFLTYLKPLINGNGFYHFESQTREHGRIDLVVDFLKQQFILEMKLWYGDKRHQEAYDQLAGYLKSKNKDRGYLLTFDFRKKPDEKITESQWVEWDGKQIFDVVLNVAPRHCKPAKQSGKSR